MWQQVRQRKRSTKTGRSQNKKKKTNLIRSDLFCNLNREMKWSLHSLVHVYRPSQPWIMFNMWTVARLLHQPKTELSLACYCSKLHTTGMCLVWSPLSPRFKTGKLSNKLNVWFIHQCLTKTFFYVKWKCIKYKWKKWLWNGWLGDKHVSSGVNPSALKEPI